MGLHFPLEITSNFTIIANKWQIALKFWSWKTKIAFSCKTYFNNPSLWFVPTCLTHTLSVSTDYRSFRFTASSLSHSLVSSKPRHKHLPWTADFLIFFILKIVLLFKTWSRRAKIDSTERRKTCCFEHRHIITPAVENWAFFTDCLHSDETIQRSTYRNYTHLHLKKSQMCDHLCITTQTKSIKTQRSTCMCLFLFLNQIVLILSLKMYVNIIIMIMQNYFCFPSTSKC